MSSTKAARRASTHNRFPIGEGFEFTGHRDTRWCVGRQIGEGTFSYVFELRRVDKDKRVAIKFAKLPRGRPDRAATRAALFAEFEKIRLIARTIICPYFLYVQDPHIHDCIGNHSFGQQWRASNDCVRLRVW
jgi:hypothetical protein